jgi:hypothetical protein
MISLDVDLLSLLHLERKPKRGSCKGLG